MGIKVHKGVADKMRRIVRNTGGAYDPSDDMLKMKSTQKKWKSDFAGTTLSSDKWEVLQQGTGHTISVAGGELTIATGTTINSETILLSKETFSNPLRALFGFMLSQKIANQEFYIEIVSVDPDTGLPDSQNLAGWKIAFADSPTNDFAKYRVQSSGIAVLESAAVDTNVPQTAYGIYEVEMFADEAWFHARGMDSANGRSYSNVRHQNIPGSDSLYKVQLRAKNLGVAPASTTSFKFQFVNVIDYAELTAEITAGRGNAATGQAIATQVLNTVTANATSTGNVAHDGVASGNPVRTAGRAVTANYTPVATGDVADFVATTVGVQIEKPYSIPEADWQVAPANVTVNTDVALKTAGGATLRNYVTGIQLKNVSMVDTEVVIKDGATIIWRGFLPQSMKQTDVIVFNTPLRGSLNTAMNFQCVTASNVYVSAQGYQAP